ncbi:hypothetical protein H0R92_12995 [Treponema sp. OMZ 840]|uniref:hypothetical protein n=1 Tax=Treponema sp. OMZ 840 TaxID=244313 RepID=UPI003D92CC54
MEINHNFAAVCIVLGVVFLGISMQFDHIIGGNADSGYHREEIYMVYNKKADRHVQVSKPVWYANYVYMQQVTCKFEDKIFLSSVCMNMNILCNEGIEV